MVFTQNYDLARGWMMTSNLRLDGDSPFERIQKKGDAGIRAVTNLLEEQLF
jgi:hypothetical protein